MEVKQHYNNLTERQKIITEWEGKKYQMLHDDFDSDWKSGDEPHGTMTFTDVMPPSPPPPIDWQAQWDAGTMVGDKIKVLARMLGLQV